MSAHRQCCCDQRCTTCDPYGYPYGAGCDADVDPPAWYDLIVDGVSACLDQCVPSFYTPTADYSIKITGVVKNINRVYRLCRRDEFPWEPDPSAPAGSENFFDIYYCDDIPLGDYVTYELHDDGGAGDCSGADPALDLRLFVGLILSWGTSPGVPGASGYADIVVGVRDHGAPLYDPAGGPTFPFPTSGVRFNLGWEFLRDNSPAGVGGSPRSTTLIATNQPDCVRVVGFVTLKFIGHLGTATAIPCALSL